MHAKEQAQEIFYAGSLTEQAPLTINPSHDPGGEPVATDRASTLPEWRCMLLAELRDPEMWLLGILALVLVLFA